MEAELLIKKFLCDNGICSYLLDTVTIDSDIILPENEVLIMYDYVGIGFEIVTEKDQFKDTQGKRPLLIQDFITIINGTPSLICFKLSII